MREEQNREILRTRTAAESRAGKQAPRARTGVCVYMRLGGGGGAAHVALVGVDVGDDPDCVGNAAVVLHLLGNLQHLATGMQAGERG